MDADRNRTIAVELARRLTIGHRSLAVALSAIIEVEAAITAAAATAHLTTPCHAGVHDVCWGTCMCHDCEAPCECPCHE